MFLKTIKFCTTINIYICSKNIAREIYYQRRQSITVSTNIIWTFYNSYLLNNFVHLCNTTSHKIQHTRRKGISFDSMRHFTKILQFTNKSAYRRAWARIFGQRFLYKTYCTTKLSVSLDEKIENIFLRFHQLEMLLQKQQKITLWKENSNICSITYKKIRWHLAQRNQDYFWRRKITKILLQEPHRTICCREDLKNSPETYYKSWWHLAQSKLEKSIINYRLIQIT